MKNIALLDYLFMFDPGETWSNLYQFEGDIMKFFEERGLMVTIVKTVDGGTGRRIMLIEKPEEKVPEQPKLPQKTLNQTIASMTSKRGFDGKYRK